MYLNEGIYTSLTWLQLAIGVVFGLAPVALTILLKRVLYMRELAALDGSLSSPRKWDTQETVEKPDGPSADSRKVISVLRNAYYTLGALVKKEEPVFFWALVEGAQDLQKEHRDVDLLTAAAIRSTLDRLVAHGDIQVETRGFCITDHGRKLFTRLAALNGIPERNENETARVCAEKFPVSGGMNRTARPPGTRSSSGTRVRMRRGTRRRRILPRNHSIPKPTPVALRK